MSDLDPSKPHVNAELLAYHLMDLQPAAEHAVIPDEIILAGKPAAVSLLAEGYTALAAIRARDRDALIAKPDELLSLLDFSTGPRDVDRARGARLGQLIVASPLFRGAFFAHSRLAHSTGRTGTAQSTLLEDINRTFTERATRTSAKTHAELCLAGMHAYTTRASIYSNGKGYLDGLQVIEAKLEANGSSDQQVSASLKTVRPEESNDLETYFESILDLSKNAIALMASRAALIKRHESLPARFRRRLQKSVR
jgi:hypothetical protein